MAAVGAHFTPSLLDAEILERLFVARHHLLDDAVGRIERAATSEERAAKLFVGPRGAGKTHLVSLVYHRAKALPGFGERFQLAWLPEDMWTISSFEDVAAEIVAAVEPAIEAAGDRPVAALIEAARRRGPIVVLVENLDAVLEAIGGEGQRALRAVLENHRPLLLIATATRLGDELLSQSEPFYGFFDTTTLEPFDIDDAASMLKRIAEVNGDPALAADLDGVKTRNRLATVAHLAGGQPRVWALLGSGLTIERLDDLVSTLMERFDDLTPYYQQQLDRLSLHERKAVRALAAAEGTLTVSQLAERTRIEARSLAKTISELRRRGWIVRRTGLLAEMGDQRRSYYQLAEPLARLAFQLKEARGRPVGLVVDFLKAWFDYETLEPTEGTSRVVELYKQAAHESIQSDAALVVAKMLADQDHLALTWDSNRAQEMLHPAPSAVRNSTVEPLLLGVDDAVAAFGRGDPEPLLGQPPAISHMIERQLVDRGIGRTRLGLARIGLIGSSAERWVPRLRELCAVASVPISTESASLLALHHLRRSEYGPADILLGGVVTAASAETAPLLLSLGEALLAQKMPARACHVLEAALAHLEPGAYLQLAVALDKGYQLTGRAKDSVEVWEKACHALQVAYGRDHRDTLTSRNNLAYTYESVGDFARAISSFEAAAGDRERVLGPDHPDTLAGYNNLASAYWSAGDQVRAIETYEATLTRSNQALGPDHPLTLTSRNNLASAYHMTGNLEVAIAMYESTLSGRERVVGTDHPDTLASRNNLASAYQMVGEVGRAIPLYEATATAVQRILGPDDPQTITIRNNLASAYGSAGDLYRAIELYKVTLEASERVLGSDHSLTRSTRDNLAAATQALGTPGSEPIHPTVRSIVNP